MVFRQKKVQYIYETNQNLAGKLQKAQKYGLFFICIFGYAFSVWSVSNGHVPAKFTRDDHVFYYGAIYGPVGAYVLHVGAGRWTDSLWPFKR